MPLRHLGHKAQEDAGRPTGRTTVLDMPLRTMRVLRVGEDDHPSSEASHGDELRPSEVRGRSPRRRSEEEEQKPKDGEAEVCSSRNGADPGRRLEEDDGPWMPAENTMARRTLRKIQAGQVPHLKAALKFQVKVAEKEWKEEEGLVPLREERTVRIQAWLSSQAKLEDEFGVEKETQLNQRQRKQVMKGLQTVSEVFSPPRIAKEAERQGMKPGTSFDLKTGWDLSNPAQKKEMWKKLEAEQPELLIICPPCVAFSILQHLNYPKMGWGKAWMLLSTGVEHLELAMELAKWQRKRGKYFMFEHPASALSWKEPCVQKVENMPGVLTAITDMCMFGLNVSGGGLNKKPRSSC